MSVNGGLFTYLLILCVSVAEPDLSNFDLLKLMRQVKNTCETENKFKISLVFVNPFLNILGFERHTDLQMYF